MEALGIGSMAIQDSGGAQRDTAQPNVTHWLRLDVGLSRVSRLPRPALLPGNSGRRVGAGRVSGVRGNQISHDIGSICDDKHRSGLPMFRGRTTLAYALFSLFLGNLLLPLSPVHPVTTSLRTCPCVLFGAVVLTHMQPYPP